MSILVFKYKDREYKLISKIESIIEYTDMFKRYYKNVPERLREALDYSNHAIELDGTDPVSYIERAEIKRHLHDVGGAILDCESAIELAPNYYRSYFIRGDIKL